MEWSWTALLVSVAAVIASGAIAWAEGNWSRRPGLAMGFVNHGGMWGDLVLLPIANAVIAPYLRPGAWLPLALAAATIASLWVHVHWYRPNAATHSHEHMWPAHARGSWWRDLSWAGWAHVVYVVGELTLLIGFLVTPVPEDVVAVVAIVFTLHVPLGLLQPRWFLTGEIATPRKQPLLIPLLACLWIVALVKAA